jgi:PAS domain S-box-containing protein
VIAVNIESASTASALGQQEASFLSLAETLSSLIALIQGDKLIYVNPAGCSLLGRPKEFFIGRNFWEVVHPDDREGAIARGRARLAGIPQPKRIVERLVHADGRTIWMDYSVDVLQLRGGPATLVTGIDVTERKRVEEELQRSEARLTEAQRIGHIGSWEWDVTGSQVTWSAELCRILGVAPCEFGGTLEGYLGIVHPDDRVMARRVMEEALRDGGPFAFEHRVVHKDGAVRTIFGWGEVFLDPSGTPVRVAGTAQDITERRLGEQALKESEERFRNLSTQAPVMLMAIDPGGRIRDVSNHWLQTMGYERAEVVGRSGWDFLARDTQERLRDAIAENERSGEKVIKNLPMRVIRKDGTTIDVLNTSVAQISDSGELRGVIGVSLNVTELKKAEEALWESEQRFRNLCAQAPVMLLNLDSECRVREVSNYWLQTMGYERGEVVGRDADSFLTPESQESLNQAIEETERRHETVIKNLPLRSIRKDGTTIDILSTSVAQLDDACAMKGVICVSINVSELKRAEEALRESEERYRALVEHAPEAIMVMDAGTGLFVDTNAHAEKLYGYSREQLLTMGPPDLCALARAGMHHSPAEECEEKLQSVLKGETVTFEVIDVDSAGREFPCQIRLSKLPARGRDLIRCAATDISDLKQLQEKIRLTDKMAAVGVLAAGVAHEIGNPLLALSMAAQSLERRACDEYTEKKLGLIREHIDRISRIVRQMSDLARPQSRKKAGCDINQVVRRAVEMVRYDKRSKNSEVRYELVESLPMVEAVEDELTQVCINLALNAFDAMASNPADRARALTVRSKRSGSAVHITFQDTGPGVPKEIRPRIFQPFFTTKEAGRGNGLGLCVSFRILEEHGGALRLEEGDGPGATFTIDLPIRNQP